MESGARVKVLLTVANAVEITNPWEKKLQMLLIALTTRREFWVCQNSGQVERFVYYPQRSRVLSMSTRICSDRGWMEHLNGNFRLELKTLSNLWKVAVVQKAYVKTSGEYVSSISISRPVSSLAFWMLKQARKETIVSHTFKKKVRMGRVDKYWNSWWSHFQQPCQRRFCCWEH